MSGVARMHDALGRALAFWGWNGGAAQAFAEAARAWPSLPGVHFRLGESQMRLRQWVPAVASLRRALEQRPGDTEAQANLVVVLARSGKWDDAETALRRLIDLQPREAELHVLLGALLRRRRLAQDAIRSFRQALQLPPCPQHCRLGEAVLGAEGWHEVREAYEFAVTAEGGDTPARAGTPLHHHPEPLGDPRPPRRR